MLIYISGAISSDNNYREKFARAEKHLTDKGHEAINPAKVGDCLPELKHEQYLHIDKSLIDICDAVYFLKDFRKSKGATEEFSHIDCENEFMRIAFSDKTRKYSTFRKFYRDARNTFEIKLIFEGENEDEL